MNSNICKTPKASLLLILIFLLFAAQIIYMGSSKEQANREYALLQELKSMKTLYQKINMTFDRNMNHRSFDAISKDINVFSGDLVLLQQHSLFDEKNKHKEFFALYDKLRKDFELSQSYIERYKSWNSLTINSTRVLYDMHGYMKALIVKESLGEDEQAVIKLLDELIFTVALISYDSLSAEELDTKMHDLKKALSSKETLQNALNTMQKHIVILIDGYAYTEALKTENDRLNVGDTVDKIYALLLKNFDDRDQADRYKIYILNALVLLLLIFLFIASRRESLLRNKVCNLNQDLNENIDTLESVNKELKGLLSKYDMNVIASETDTKGVITYASQAFCDISGFTQEELLGKAHNIVRHPDVAKEVFEEMWTSIKSGKEWHGEVKNLRKDGSFYWVEVTASPEYDKDGNITGYSAIRHDITARKELEELSSSLEKQIHDRTHELESMMKKVEILSITDELTGLYNRRYYSQILNNEIKRAKRRGAVFGYLILDIDNFKPYNDYYGHQLGDTALEKIAHKLTSVLSRPDDFVFRMGGEEFVVIFTGDDKDEAVGFAKKIINSVASIEIEHIKNEPYGVITASGGLVVSTPEAERMSVDEYYKRSDVLLYEAKDSGRNGLKVDIV